MFDILELHMKLQEACAARDPHLYRARTAAIQREKDVERRERDIVLLLDEGHNAADASYILDIPFLEVARIEERNQARRRFLATGRLPFEDGGYFAIHSGLPTRR